MYKFYFYSNGNKAIKIKFIHILIIFYSNGNKALFQNVTRILNELIFLLK